MEKNNLKLDEWLHEGETTFIYWGEHRNSDDARIFHSRNLADNALRLHHTPAGIEITCEKCRRTGECEH